MIEIKSPVTKDDFKAYYAVRYKTLREPMGHLKGTEKDDYEPISKHFMAVESETGQVLGVIKLFEKSPGVGNFSHLAIDPEHQRQGIGRMLLDAVENCAREEGFKTLGTMSRVTASVYFERRGYAIRDLPTLHLGTIHLVWMEKDL
jgi:N-acetylglutamate synthase-like GNAT family acetyltransferase